MRYIGFAPNQNAKRGRRSLSLPSHECSYRGLLHNAMHITVLRCATTSVLTYRVICTKGFPHEYFFRSIAEWRPNSKSLNVPVREKRQQIIIV